MRYKRFSGEGKTVYKPYCYRCEKILENVGSMAQKYCDGCKKIINREKTKERMRKYRERKAVNTE